jgi:hypothetical protein
VSAELTLSPHDAKRARLGSGGSVRIARGADQLAGGAATRLTVRLTSGARRALARLTRSVRATLTISFADATGNRRTLRRAITLLPKPKR